MATGLSIASATGVATHGADNASAVSVQKTDGTNVLVVDTTNKEIEARNASKLRGFSDDGTTETFSIDGATGTTKGAMQDRGGQVFNVKAYGAKGDGVIDDAAAIQAAIDACAAAGGGDVFVPPGTYLLKTWVLVKSNVHLYGTGEASVLRNDKTNAVVDKRACLLIGNHHPANMASQTKYNLNAIAQGDATITATTAGDTANFALNELVIVGSQTNLSGVSRHAQLNKIKAIAAGVITLQDPIEAAISDGAIWKISGTDASTATAIYAVENVTVEKLAFQGRSALASKAAVFGGIFRDLTMLDVDNFISTGLLSNCLFENLDGLYTSRYLEFAFNSYNITARNWKGRLSAGPGSILPIHLGEQCYRILLDNVQCHLDPRFTFNAEVLQVKGSAITLRNCDFRHGGTAGSQCFQIPDGAYTGFGYEGILFENCRLAAPGKARIGTIGGSTENAQNPRAIDFRGGTMVESTTTESLWFQAGSGLSCSMLDRTGKTFKVSVARYPYLSGYRRMV